MDVNPIVVKLIVACDATVHVKDAHLAGRAGYGQAACGVVYLNGTKDLETCIEERGRHLGPMTVPEAEYAALIYALEYAPNLCRWEVEVWLDNKTVVKHLTGEFRLKANNLKPLFDRVRALEHRFDSVKYFHHKRDDPVAQRADQVAHNYLQKQ